MEGATTVDMASVESRLHDLVEGVKAIRSEIDSEWLHEEWSADVLWWGRGMQALDVARDQLLSVMWMVQRRRTRETAEAKA